VQRHDGTIHGNDGLPLSAQGTSVALEGTRLALRGTFIDVPGAWHGVVRAGFEQRRAPEEKRRAWHEVPFATARVEALQSGRRVANLGHAMARVVLRSIRQVIGEARRALGMSQKEFGYAVGSSHRSAVRWDAGQSTPGRHELRKLAGLLYPIDRDLAVEVSAGAGETLESLGLEVPPPPPPPPPPAPVVRPEDLVEIVVLAAVEQTGATPADARRWLHAVFKRAHDIGLTTDVVEKALRPAAQGAPRSPRGGKTAP
jgi:ribosome-binding protein aMBF1 (putative translation factor)